MGNIRKWLSWLSIRLKFLFSFSITLILLLTFVTVVMVINFSGRVMRESREFLSMFTGQVIINFSQSQHAVEMQLFNICNMFHIPGAMHEVIQDKNTTTISHLQGQVNMIVSNLFPFDVVLVNVKDGTQIDTAFKTGSEEAVRHMSVLLNNFRDQIIEKSILWIRDDDGTVYLARMVMATSPLRYVGEVIARIPQNNLFKINEKSGFLDYIFLFLNEDDDNIIVEGDIEEKLRIKIIADYKSGNINNEIYRWGNSKYFISIIKEREWTVVGILPLKRLYNQIWLIVFASVIVGIIAMAIGTGAVYKITARLTMQLNLLIKSMNAVAQGSIKQVIPVQSMDDFGKLAVHFNRMTDEIARLLNRVVQEEKLKNKAEIQLLEYRCRSLQNQINPHFIYNAFETVNAMAKISGNDEIGSVVRLMSKYFRHNTLSMNMQFISLEKEIDNLEDYVEIYRYIYGDQLVCTFNFPDSLNDTLVPTMILQPILENAIIHGKRPPGEASIISISAAARDEYSDILIVIKDNGFGMTSEDKNRVLEGRNPIQTPYEHTGIGISNISERLKLLYGDKAGIVIDSDKNGTKVSVWIPLCFTMPQPVFGRFAEAKE
jgi:sensor histidine kinase YesM